MHGDAADRGEVRKGPPGVRLHAAVDYPVGKQLPRIG